MCTFSSLMLMHLAQAWSTHEVKYLLRKLTACVAYTTVFLEPGRSGTVWNRAINLTFTTGGCRLGSSACWVLHYKCTQTELETRRYASFTIRIGD